MRHAIEATSQPVSSAVSAAGWANPGSNSRDVAYSGADALPVAPRLPPQKLVQTLPEAVISVAISENAVLMLSGQVQKTNDVILKGA